MVDTAVFGKETCLARHCLNHLEMLRLGRTHYIKRSLRPYALHMVNHACQVSSGVVVATISLTNNEWQWFVIAIGETIGEYHFCTVVHFKNAGCIETLYNFGKQIVVCALAHEVTVVQQHTQLRVHLVEIASAFVHQSLPILQGFGVATLQHHNTLTCTSLEFF